MNYRDISDTSSLRFPAEWELDCAILLSWPHKDSDWVDILDEVTECYVNMVAAFAKYHPVIVVAPDISIPQHQLRHIDKENILFFQTPTNDTWVRDYGPLTIIDSDGAFSVNDYAFNGWGLKFAADKDNLVTASLCRDKLIIAPRNNHLGFVLEGGSVESDGHGTILTTSECLLSPNRNGDLSRTQIEEYLCHSLGAKRILWLDHGGLAGDDTDSHIDTLARIAPHNTIYFVATDDKADRHFESLAAMKEDLLKLRTAEGSPYNLIALPLPDAIYDEDGYRLPATYANYLATPKAIFLPVYGQKQNDYLASQLMRIAFPQHDIVEIDCNALIKQHGSLHCSTMQLPIDILPL